MSKESLRNYIQEISCLFKDYARQAKVDADHPKEGDSADFKDGFLMAYHQVIAVMKNQAPFFDLTQEEINLADIEPEQDLI
jgi:hypothetical protein